jgi:hypothetical protein
MTPTPAIQHATTAGGVRIAYHTIESGPPVVMRFPYHVNHLRQTRDVSIASSQRGELRFTLLGRPHPEGFRDATGEIVLELVMLVRGQTSVGLTVGLLAVYRDVRLAA